MTTTSAPPPFPSRPAPATLRSRPTGAAVYRGGPPGPERTLWDVLATTARRFPDAPALDDGRSVRTYTDLLADVAALRDRLAAAGVGRGDRVGVRVTSGTADLYLAVLGVLAAGAAYVPVDADDPEDRARLLLTEAGVCAVVGDGGVVTRHGTPPSGRPAAPPGPDDDAWVIFTSGTTGTPKGVAVTHRSAAAFVDAEAGLFLRADPLGPGDRVLAGLSVAFDASCEEMWLAWRSGACLVPAPRAVVRTGPELCGWLVERRISVVSTVPTLASMWPVSMLRGIRLLVLGGEACPAELADRLSGACGEVWNTYGPTETTVVASAARLRPHTPVRIGLPLEGWDLAVVDPASGEPLPWGETGELVIGGVGVARYLDPERDAARFRPLPALGWSRAYRSGDLVQADPGGLRYVGRADSQVKIRGYRIELTEIESVLGQVPGIARAVVGTHEPQPGLVELVGYYTVADGGPPLDEQSVHDVLRGRLPAHMVPAHLERLTAIPTTLSGKTDRAALPAPTRRALAGAAPATPAEAALAAALADVLGVESVPVDAHLFDQLQVNSLVVAHLCARARDLDGLPPLSAREVYLHPTIRELAAVLDRPASPAPPAEPEPVGPATRPGTGSVVRCGVLQLLLLLANAWLAAVLVDSGVAWLAPTSGVAGSYLRSVAFGTAGFALLCLLPVTVKWLVIGRWEEREIPLWSPAYVRFWLVRTLLRVSPLARFGGSPLYAAYLRLLGARIGPRVVILSSHIPVCTDLVSIGADTVIRRGARLSGYTAVQGRIRTGPVTIGSDAHVGHDSVLSPGSVLGDGARLGHASCLFGSQEVPAGERWSGVPARPTDVDHVRVEPLPCSRLRPALFAAGQLAVLLLVTLPAGLLLAGAVLRGLADLAGVSGSGSASAGELLRDAVLISAVSYVGGLLAGLVVATTVPRLVSGLLLRPGRTHRLYGVHHWAQRVVERLTNVPVHLQITGDTSYVVHYLRLLGYRLPDLEQTGSNFGATLHHESPYLVSVGRGTQISDSVSFLNADFTSTSFRLAPVAVGARCFVGNSVAFPPGHRVGEDCLVGNKTAVPLDGPVRQGVGLVGAPSFEIPRSVERDSRFDHFLHGEAFRRGLAGKDRHNLATIGLFLLVRWLLYLLLTVLVMVAWDLHERFGVLAVAGLTVASFLVTLAYDLGSERLLVGRRRLQPTVCSIYQPYFWWHERHWKLQSADHTLPLLDGTPFKPVAWRLLGVRVGRRLFDDGCSMPERSLVTLGDDCVLNAGSTIQCHSMEDGTFRSDVTRFGDRCTLGVSGYVHYGVTVGDDAVLGPDTFVMKGTTVPPGTRWMGNPAAETRTAALPRA
ncbi:Pls/PosA family non-ribosomal peptide synthetase [Geodermatophilus sp. SYSU D00742]